MRTRHLVTGVTTAASALALIAVAPASAHDVSGPAAVAAGPRITTSTLLASLVTTPLDRLSSWATALQQKVAAVPDSTVLTGRARLMAKRQLHAAVEASSLLATVKGATAAQQAELTAIRAKLAAAAAELRALLSNTPPVTRQAVKVVPTSLRTVTPLTLTRHHCDGFHDAFREHSWDGWRDGFRRR